AHLATDEDREVLAGAWSEDGGGGDARRGRDDTLQCEAVHRRVAAARGRGSPEEARDRGEIDRGGRFGRCARRRGRCDEGPRPIRELPGEDEDERHDERRAEDALLPG